MDHGAGGDLMPACEQRIWTPPPRRIEREQGGDWRRWRDTDPETLRCMGMFPGHPSGFSPAAFGGFTLKSLPKTAIWFRGDRGISATGSNVDSWANSGNNTTLLASVTQTGTARPTTTTLGGKAALQFTAASAQYMSGALGSTIAQPYTYIAVVQRTSSVVARICAATSNAGFYFKSATNPSEIGLYSGSEFLTASSFSNGTTYLLIGVVNGASSAIYSKTTSVASGNAGTTLALATTLNIGSNNTGVSNFDGQIGEFAIYTGNIVADGFLTVASNAVSAYWGI